MLKKKVLPVILLVGVLFLSACNPIVSSVTKPVSSPTTTIISSGSAGKLEVFSDGNQISDLLISGDDLWAATAGGLVRWDIQKGTYRKYTVADGLSGSFAEAMTLDKQSNIWFTIGGGVSRFDGTHFQNFTDKDGLTATGRSIICDNNGNIITANDDSAISLYDGKTWQTILPQNPALQPATPDYELNRSFIHRLVADNNGNIWALTTSAAQLGPIEQKPTYSVEYFDGKLWHSPTDAAGWTGSYHALDAATLAKAPDGGICFLTTDDFSTVEYNGKSRQTIAHGYPGSKPLLITFDSQGTLWALNDTGIGQYDGQRWHTYANDKLSGGQDGLTSITIDKNGSAWCGSAKSIFRFDGQSWHSYTTKDNLTNNNVHSLFTDNLGDIWFNTFSETTTNVYSDIVKMVVPGYGFVNDALTRYDGKTWRTFTEADGLPQDIVIGCYFQDKKGNIWVGAGAGQVFYYDGRTWQPVDVHCKDGISGIAEDNQGNLWFSAGDNVIRYDGKSFQQYSMNTAGQDQDSLVRDLALDKQGNIWASTNYGIRRFNGTDWQVFTTKDGLIGNSIGKIFVDSQGRLWFADRGVDLFDGQKWSSFPTADPGESIVTSMAENRQRNIWAVEGSGKGVNKYDDSNTITITTADGLVSDHVYSILTDVKGNLWFCTDNGLSRYDGKTWQAYAQKVGFYGQTIITKDGSLWSISGGGLIHFIPGNR